MIRVAYVASIRNWERKSRNLIVRVIPIKYPSHKTTRRSELWEVNATSGLDWDWIGQPQSQFDLTVAILESVWI